MFSPFRRVLSSFGLVAALGVASVAHAGPYTSLTVFGDSLSDTGNVLITTGGAVPQPPYFNGRFSDGPVWIDFVAGQLGLPSGAVPALWHVDPGSNYAFGGARTGSGASPPGLLAQFGGLWAPNHPTGADPTGLYVVVGGGNDMRDARTAFPGGGGADGVGRQAAATAAAINIATLVGGLATAGARHVLIVNLPDLGDTPEAIAGGVVAASRDASMRFNAALAGLPGALETAYAGLDVDLADWFGLFQAVLNDPSAFGITNTSAPCNGFPGSPNLGVETACLASVFSDDVNPSSHMHGLLARSALDALGIPEPTPLALVSLALVTLAVLARRRRRLA